MIGSLPTASAFLTIRPCSSTGLAPIVTLKKPSSTWKPSSTVVCKPEDTAHVGVTAWIDAVVVGGVDGGTGAEVLSPVPFPGLTSVGSGGGVTGASPLEPG